jgi:hypothetical protein
MARVLTGPEAERAGAFTHADFVVEFEHASFFMKDKRITARNVGVIDMRQIAPTFAAVLGIELPQARLPAVAVRDDALLSRRD